VLPELNKVKSLIEAACPISNQGLADFKARMEPSTPALTA